MQRVRYTIHTMPMEDRPESSLAVARASVQRGMCRLQWIDRVHDDGHFVRWKVVFSGLSSEEHVCALPRPKPQSPTKRASGVIKKNLKTHANIKLKPQDRRVIKTHVKKKPSSFKVKKARKNKVLIIQMDESYLNKKKPGKLSKGGEAHTRSDLGMGAVVQGRPDLFSSESWTTLWTPSTVARGGKEEMAYSLNLIQLPKNSILVSDCWRVTIAGVQEHRRQLAFTERDLPHELVNHEQLEIINENGFTTK